MGDDQNRIIQAVGEAGGSVKRMEVEIDSIDPTISVASWREIADF
jgi:hypothetical protein